jgi:hypothetical protein
MPGGTPTRFPSTAIVDILVRGYSVGSAPAASMASMIHSETIDCQSEIVKVFLLCGQCAPTFLSFPLVQQANGTLGNISQDR